MLNRFTRILRFHKQAFSLGLSGLKRNALSSVSTVLAIALTLLLPLLFGALVVAINPLLQDWREGEQIALYLEDGFSSKQENELMQKIRATPGVQQVRFISAAESLQLFEQQEGLKQIHQYLPENPLPAMIEVMPTAAVNTTEKLEALMNQLLKYPHVEQGKMNKEWASRLHAMLHFVAKLAWLLGSLFTFMVLFIIRNLLRLAAEEHHEEIQVLKLIGAKDAFILRPFLYIGLILGGLGAGIAFMSVQVILKGMGFALHPLIAPGLDVPLQITFIWSDVVFCVMAGMCLGWVGAYASLKQQLGRIEPCH